MSNYTYEAMNASGKSQKGNVEANSADEAAKKIRELGFFPTAVREQKVKGGFGEDGKKAVTRDAKKKKGFNLNLSFGGVSTKKLTLFTRQLSTCKTQVFRCSVHSRSLRASNGRAR